MPDTPEVWFWRLVILTILFGLAFLIAYGLGAIWMVLF